MRSSSRSNSLLRAAAALALLAVPLPATAGPAKLAPIDQCGSDRGFAKFRAALNTAIAKEDEKALLRLMAPDVLVDFGGGRGPAAFAETWGLDGDPSELWVQLRAFPRMGCARSGGAFVIPSLPLQWDSEDDVEEMMLVIGPDAGMRRDRDYGSPVIARLAWDLVTVTDNGSDFQSGVRLADGRQGYLSDSDLYSPIGLRIVAEKRGGKWMITAFVAGD